MNKNKSKKIIKVFLKTEKKTFESRRDFSLVLKYESFGYKIFYKKYDFLKQQRKIFKLFNWLLIKKREKKVNFKNFNLFFIKYKKLFVYLF